jgi:Cdc6-like AAA superfamily ATPase
MKAGFLEAIHSDPWADDFIDLPSLNRRVSDAIETSIQSVRQLARAEPRALRSTSLVVLGPPGAGKTHLFARLRRRLGPRAVFVHVRPLVHGPMTPRFVLSECVRQLGYATHGVLQAGALVGSLLGYLSGSSTSFPTAFLNEHERLESPELEARLESAVERVLEIWQEADEIYLRRLLRVPFVAPPIRRALLAWLSGRDCEVSQLDRIGASAPLSEDLALPALRTLFAVASLGAPIVIVFDQLENLAEREGSGAQLLAYANLTAELVDSMRGLVLVHMALDTEWSRAIDPTLNLSQRSRLVMRQETMALPSPLEREELLRLWIERIPDRPAPFPWPFSEARLSRLKTETGFTPRMLLVECRGALEGEDVSREEASVTNDASSSGRTAESSESVEGLQEEWDQRLEAARRLADEASEERSLVAAERIVDGLLACTRFVSSFAKVSPKAIAPAQLVLEMAGRPAQVAVLHQAHHRALATAFTKLTALAGREYVVAIRDRSEDLRPTWKDTLAKLQALLATGRARWVLVDRDDIVRLLALDALLQGARSGDVTNRAGRPLAETEVVDWATTALDVPHWNIVVELAQVWSSAATVSTNGNADADAASRVTDTSHPRSLALPLLRRLRIASLDRMVREAARVDPAATRASVLAELEAAGDKVRWFGRTIVCVRRGT